MEFIDTTASSIKENIENIGKSIYSHKNITKIIHNTEDAVIFPTPSSRTLEDAESAIKEMNCSYYILHTAHHTGKYYLILMNFENKLYKVFFYLYDDTELSYNYFNYN